MSPNFFRYITITKLLSYLDGMRQMKNEAFGQLLMEGNHLKPLFKKAFQAGRKDLG